MSAWRGEEEGEEEELREAGHFIISSFSFSLPSSLQNIQDRDIGKRGEGREGNKEEVSE